jgi:pyruvate formate lyase activating enzyme
MKEAMFYEKLNNMTVKCGLCPHNCIISDKNIGICGVRKNISGKLYSLVYGKAVAEHVDPIEKKPLFHVLPGSLSYSISTMGCNFKCLHCQNSDISQIPKDRDVITGNNRTPQEIVNYAIKTGCKSISYTYTEPTIYFEYAYETSIIASKNGLKNIFVTNGYINEGPLSLISPYLYAANIDLKAFTENFYNKTCAAKLQPVLEAIKNYKKLGIWVEITTLIIPSMNDNYEELEKIAAFISELGKETPWHVTAFHPTYRLNDHPGTSSKTLINAREIGLKSGLRYVYTGNIPGGEGENTYCYNCGNLLIRRLGFQVVENNIKSSLCSKCKTTFDGLGI